jgi:hypothetical protein
MKLNALPDMEHMVQPCGVRLHTLGQGWHGKQSDRIETHESEMKLVAHSLTNGRMQMQRIERLNCGRLRYTDSPSEGRIALGNSARRWHRILLTG